jgi:putative phage-type endonuclease
VIDRTHIYPDRAAWLAARRGSIGASSVAALLGLSPHRGPWDVWTELRTDAEPEPERDDEPADGLDLADPLVWGTVVEPMVLALYARKVGAECRPVGDWLGAPGHLAITRHPRLSFLHASLDGLSLRDGELGAVEAKTARQPWLWGRDGAPTVDPDHPEAPVPQHYYIQAQVQIACSGLPWCDVAALTGGTLRVYRLDREPSVIAGIEQAVATWYERHIVGGEEPDVDASDACVRYQRAKLGERRGVARAATVEEEADIAAMAAAKAADALSKAARARVLARLATEDPPPKAILSGRHRLTITSNGALRLTE